MLAKIKSKLYTLLRKSEKYTKTDMVYLASGGFWLGFSKFIASFAGLALAIAFANLIPPDVYGTYKYVLTVVGIVSITALPGMNLALTRAVAKGYSGTLRSVITSKIKFSLLGSLALVVTGLYYLIQDNNILGITFLVIAPLLPLMEGLIVYGPYLNGKKLFKVSSILVIIHQLLLSAVMIVTLFITNNPVVIIITYFIAVTGIQIGLFLITLKKYKPNTKILKETTGFGKHLSFMEVIGTVASHIDKLLMWYFFGAVQLAVYSFAIAPIKEVRALLRTLTTLAFPKLSKKPLTELKKTLPQKIILLTCIIAIFIAVYFISAQYIFTYLFPQYTEAVQYSVLYALSLFFYPQGIVSSSFSAHKKVRELYIINTVAPVLKIILLVVLIPLYGIYGAILSVLIPSAINTGIVFYLFKKA